MKPDPSDTRTHKRRSLGWPPGSQDISDALTYLRNHGIIPWTWITDETSRLTDWHHARNRPRVRARPAGRGDV